MQEFGSRGASRSWRELRWRIDDVLERADGRPGHIFNLGHGLVPQTPVDNVRLLVGTCWADIGVTTGVLVMAYGGPDSLDDIPGYLADIRAGRTTPRHVVDEITENYRAIGGRSPLLEVTRKQVDALGRVGGYACYLGMRHWSPWIEDVVGEMVEDGITRAVGLVLAPHFSALSVAKYQQRVETASTSIAGRSRSSTFPAITTRPG